MRLVVASAAALAAVVGLAAPSRAQTLIESYVAHLSEQDHFNSSGSRLTTAAGIIRQDRANFHRFGKRDGADQPDRYFSDAINRESLERMVERGPQNPALFAQIVNGTPIVRIEIFQGPSGPFVRVAPAAAPANVPAPTAPASSEGGGIGTR